MREDTAVELTEAVLARLEASFPADLRAEVKDLLVHECGRNLPYCGEPGKDLLIERIRIGVLRVSAGNMEDLLRAIELAQVDWRDLLVAAGFGESTEAHLEWWP